MNRATTPKRGYWVQRWNCLCSADSCASTILCLIKCSSETRKCLMSLSFDGSRKHICFQWIIVFNIQDFNVILKKSNDDWLWLFLPQLPSPTNRLNCWSNRSLHTDIHDKYTALKKMFSQTSCDATRHKFWAHLVDVAIFCSAID